MPYKAEKESKTTRKSWAGNASKNSGEELCEAHTKKREIQDTFQSLIQMTTYQVLDTVLRIFTYTISFHHHQNPAR